MWLDISTRYLSEKLLHVTMFTNLGIHTKATKVGDNRKWRTRQRIIMPDTNHMIAVYNTHTDAEAALAKLNQASFDVKKVSIIGKDYHTEEKVLGYYTTGDRIRAWGGLGAFWGGIWGLLFGAGFFLIPGLGPVLVAGPFVAALVGALESAVVVGGVSAVFAGLVSLGVPKDRALKLESEITAGRFVLAVHGTEQEIAQAESILGATSPVSMESHPAAA